MANPWEQDEAVASAPWEMDALADPAANYARRPPQKSAWQLAQEAKSGDPAAIEAYNLRARSLGQPTLEEERAANSPVAGQNFGQNMWQAYGRVLPELGRAFDAPETVDRQRQVDAPLMDTAGGMAGTIVGNGVLLYGPQAGATRAFAATGKAAPYLAGATVGAAEGAVRPVGSGESRAGNTGRAAIWGLGGQAAGDLITAGGAKVAQALTPAQADLYRQAKALGIELTPAQITDSRYLKTLASQSKYWAGTGGSKVAAAQQAQFNRAVSRTLGENSDVIDDPLMAQVKANRGRLYDKAFDGVQVRMDQPALDGYQALRGTLDRRLTSDQIRQFDAISQNIQSNIQRGRIEGRVYQELRKELKAIEADNKNALGTAVRDLRTILEGSASRSVPQANQQALSAADRLTRNSKVVEQARRRVANANDNVAPTSLWQPANGRYGATPEMRTLAQLGQRIKDPIADSATAARQESLATLGPLGLLMLGPKAAVGRTVQSPMLARYLAETQPRVIEGTSRQIGRALPGFALRTAPFLPAAAAADDKKRKKKDR